MKLFTFLATFSSAIDHLIEAGPQDTTVVIGGTCALIAHGLNVGQEPNDLDVIIYRPSTEQLRYLDSIRLFSLKPSTGTGADLTGDSNFGLRSLKFKKNGLILNILLERDKAKPAFLLRFWEAGASYKIQDVASVIEAKNSYVLQPNTTGLTGERYARVKDLFDFQQLKNLNFNTPYDPIPCAGSVAEQEYPQ